MPAKVPEYTAVRPRGARPRTHALLLHGDEVGVSLCGRRADGWAVAIEPLNCARCLALLAERTGGAPA